MFGGGVDGHEGGWDQTEYRGDVDHAATALGAHVGQHCVCHSHQAEDVDVEDLLGLVDRALLAGAGRAHACVVYQDVDPAEPLDHLPAQPAPTRASAAARPIPEEAPVTRATGGAVCMVVPSVVVMTSSGAARGRL